MQRKYGNNAIILWHTVLIFVGFYLLYNWELFNYATTHDPLVTMFGLTDAISTLAMVIVGVDIMFMSHSVLRAFVWKSEFESVIDSFFEDRVATGMLATWGATTFVDTFFTWFYLTGQMEITGIAAKIPNSIIEYMFMLQIVGSVVSWIAQAALIITIARSIQTLVLLASTSAIRQSRPQFQQQQQKSQPQVQHVAHNQHQTQSKPKPIPRPEPSYHPVRMDREGNATDFDRNAR